MHEINALEQACPMPVILTKRAMKEFPNEDLTVLVDNKIATQNLKKMADQLGFKTTIEQNSVSSYTVQLTKEKEENSSINQVSEQKPTFLKKETESKQQPYIVSIHSEIIGNGSQELGTTLMKSFFFSLSEQEQLPEKILFYNGGAKLTAEGSSILQDLQAMASDGVEILTCGICVEFFELEDQLMVGEATNMYRIVELQSQYKTVSP
ncbi:selenium metabolism protein YedF [Carnobacterium iners]|uniref:Selenium metabolism protein YedF n=1 Tax=Carnobacterium iners TaxID=1073423 RepID=A0A1X7MY09_9LACT|nr:sulfurtransferase-like selenium metabolism protein YedF [Carnobacterium iners]SEL26619.1 selenium metabolism protein YedF [Carnobacterium iners]SMH28907.1 selenium metabolism protein YedF [Carnobacterium iners]